MFGVNNVLTVICLLVQFSECRMLKYSRVVCEVGFIVIFEHEFSILRLADESEVRGKQGDKRSKNLERGHLYARGLVREKVDHERR